MTQIEPGTQKQSGELIFIGLGLTAKSITYAGLEAARNCDVLYLEAYTSLFSEGELAWLENKAGRKIIPLSRAQIEDEDLPLNQAADGKRGNGSSISRQPGPKSPPDAGQLVERNSSLD